MSGQGRASRASSIADAAAFGVLVVACVAIPTTFSIANPDVFAMPKTVVAVGLAGLLGALLLVRWISSGADWRRLRRDPLAWAIAAFVAWNLVGLAFAVDPAHALIGERLQYQGFGALAAYAIYLIGAWTTVRTTLRRTLLLWSIAVGAAVVAIYAVIQRAELDPIWSALSEDRVFSTIGQANALAAYLVLAIPLTIGLALGRNVAGQVLLAALAVLELAALAFTLSRGGYLGAGIMGLVLAVAFVTRREVVTRRGTAIVGAAILAIVLGVALAPDLRAAAERTVDRVLAPGDTEEASTNAHLDQWAVGMAIALDHPILGAGQDTYVLLFDDYRDEVLPADRAEVWERYRPESPHNVYLAIAGGAGVPALVTYLAVFGVAGVRTLGGMRASGNPRTWLFGACLVAAVAGHLVTDGFMTAETTGSVLFWIVLGTGAALADDVQRRPRLTPERGRCD